MTTTEVPNASDRRESYLKKVRALLTQAENPACTPEEAKSFSAKAAELMERYSFSLIELDACGKRIRDEIIHKVVFVDDPYSQAKQDLFFRICEANGVKHVAGWRRAKYTDVEQQDGTIKRTVSRDAKGKILKGRTSQLTGFSSDVEKVELLFTSLLIQATNEVFAAEVPSWENTRSFRNSFFYGYSHTIGSRLAKVNREIRDEEVVRFQEEQGHDLLPVLASRKAQVDEASFDRYSRVNKNGKRVSTLRSTNTTYSYNGGYGSGSNAAGRADLGNSRLGGRKGLGR
ncbi:MAG: DUF2786 domain-containing protein [Thaumarchaeota archaeon]|nr:DUF2786 domain-containing protein [Nitrososphaerota archaeon]